MEGFRIDEINNVTGEYLFPNVTLNDSFTLPDGKFRSIYGYYW